MSTQLSQSDMAKTEQKVGKLEELCSKWLKKRNKIHHSWVPKKRRKLLDERIRESCNNYGE